jgi:hypothetical protein
MAAGASGPKDGGDPHTAMENAVADVAAAHLAAQEAVVRSLAAAREAVAAAHQAAEEAVAASVSAAASGAAASGGA